MYYRLHNFEGHVVGFLRVAGARRQYAELQGDRWRRQEIRYADACRVDPPLGLRFLKGCR